MGEVAFTVFDYDAVATLIVVLAIVSHWCATTRLPAATIQGDPRVTRLPCLFDLDHLVLAAVMD